MFDPRPVGTKRVFIALKVTESFYRSILPVFKKLKVTADQSETYVKWVAPQNLHVTISFLGDRAPDEIDEVVRLLKKISKSVHPFDLRVSGVGAFPQLTDARVLWFGVQNKKYLGQLKDELDARLESKLRGYREQREFSPHLTIGRLKNSQSVYDMVSPFVRKDFGKLGVESLVLFESHRHGAQTVYNPIFEVKLEGQPELALEFA